MSEDIVERLKWAGQNYTALRMLTDDAEDEITTLRGEVERLRTALLPFAVARLQAGAWPDQRGYGGKPWGEAVSDYVSQQDWANAAVTYSGDLDYQLHVWKPERAPSEAQARSLLSKLKGK